MSSPRSQIAEAIIRGNRFLVTSHVNPDGDAIGSLAGFCHVLQGLKKNCVLHVPGQQIPDKYMWLDFGGEAKEGVAGNRDVSQLMTHGFAAVFVLDCGDEDRIDEELRPHLRTRTSINIDHHPDNTHFGDINWVEPKRSSVGEMIALLAKDLGLPLTGDLGEALYLAISTDTGFFTYSNTGPETLRIAAEIIQAGFDLDRFNRLVQRQSSLNTIHLHGLAMSGASLSLQGRVGVIRVDREMLRKTGTTLEDCEGLINHVRGIKNVMVALCLREEAEQEIAFSLRSFAEVDVGSIAAGFNGGGHKNAAGGKIRTTLDQAQERMIRAIENHLT